MKLIFIVGYGLMVPNVLYAQDVSFDVGLRLVVPMNDPLAPENEAPLDEGSDEFPSVHIHQFQAPDTLETIKRYVYY